MPPKVFPRPHSSVNFPTMPLMENSLPIPRDTHGGESHSVKTITKIVHLLPHCKRPIISSVAPPNATRSSRRDRHGIDNKDVQQKQKPKLVEEEQKNENQAYRDKEGNNRRRKKKCNGEKWKIGKRG